MYFRGDDVRLFKIKGSDTMARPTAILSMAILVGGVANYLYQIIMGRALGIEDYSELTALLALFYILSVPVQTIGTVVARYTSSFHAEGKEGELAWLLRNSFWLSLIVGGILALGVFIASPWLVSFLSLGSYFPLIILMAGVLFTMVSPVATGAAQGLQRFNSLSVFNLLGPICKLLFGTGLVLLGYGVSGAFGGVIVGGLIAVVYTFYAIRDHARAERRPFPTRKLFNYLFPVTVGLLCFTVMTNIDTFLARNLFSNQEASLFSAASLLGKIALWLPGAVATVMFSKVTEAHSLGRSTIELIRRSLLYVVLIGGAVTMAYFVMPETLLSVLYGAAYSPAAPALRIMGVAMLLMCVAQVFLNYGLAIDRYSFIAIIAMFTGVQIVLMLIFHDDLVQFSLAILASSIGVCVASWANMEMINRSIE